MPEIKPQAAEKPAPLPEIAELPEIKPESETQKPKIMNPFASMFGGQEPPKEKPAEKPQGSFKIQTNSMAGWDASKSPETQPEVIKVNDILDMEKPAGPVPDLPGKDVKISDKLLEKEQPAPFTGELPPLPDLEDDKGTDII